LLDNYKAVTAFTATPLISLTLLILAYYLINVPESWPFFGIFKE
jgi:hypothetical protein